MNNRKHPTSDASVFGNTFKANPYNPSKFTYSQKFLTLPLPEEAFLHYFLLS
jgi:hypothetical protein